MAWFKRLKQWLKMPITLMGGAKPRKVVGIKKGRYLGGRFEGDVYEVEVTARKGSRERKITMAEKRFLPRNMFMGPNVRNPEGQFKTMQALIELNREKKLGLRIVPTIRLRKPFLRKPRLLTTKFDVISEEAFESLPRQEKESFWEDRQRQQFIGLENHFIIEDHSFFPIRDRQAGKVVAIIADFGLVLKS